MQLPLVHDTWTLQAADETHIDAIMGWFDSKEQTRVWGSPIFRYPFTPASFREDCHWPEMSSFALHNNGLGFCAFGQIYERYSRINLARLVVHPERRGRGIGRQLVTMLLEAGPSIVQRDEFSLFVYRDNTPALKCYQALGFSIQDYPADEPLASEGYYLTRPRLP